MPGRLRRCRHSGKRMRFSPSGRTRRRSLQRGEALCRAQRQPSMIMMMFLAHLSLREWQAKEEEQEYQENGENEDFVAARMTVVKPLLLQILQQIDGSFLVRTSVVAFIFMSQKDMVCFHEFYISSWSGMSSGVTQRRLAHSHQIRKRILRMKTMMSRRNSLRLTEKDLFDENHR
ncbi:hypothetical protein CSUI_006030 [Cystoisospora suis]|uniref:Uncharacterized protein n=1 Tax=Cystoisospora suis TaxID=483139 RepID=A0A2C6KVE8_9APIC|nr:hypothetical protein CSUI_006030 [Cystoisospora suis]